jgi:hypothetical protein
MIVEELEGFDPTRPVEKGSLWEPFEQLERSLSDMYVGKPVRITKAMPSSTPGISHPAEAEGVVRRLEIGAYGDDGGGEALITLDDDTKLIIDKEYTLIEILG